MKVRLFHFAVFSAIAFIVCGCDKDVAPEKSTGSITFVITEENTPTTLSGVSIQLFSDEDKSITQSDRTDNFGRCTFSNIPIGIYSVNLSKPGYESKEGLALRINGGDNSNKEIGLKRVTTVLTVEPSMLDFGADESTVQKAFSLVNPNFETLTWAILDTEVPWIVSVCDKDGKKNDSIKYNQEVAMSVTIDRDKLSNGNNEGVIVILSDFGRAELIVKAIGADRRLPVSTMVSATEVLLSEATLTGETTNCGAPSYYERGFVYSLKPITNDINLESSCSFLSFPVNDDKTYQCKATGLRLGCTYYSRAYAKNSLGLKLSSNEVIFTTCSQLLELETLEADAFYVMNGRVTLVGNIVISGSPSYSEKGFCVNTKGDPTIEDTHFVVNGSGSGRYEYTFTQYTKDTDYYYRAYAIQNGRIVYGNVVLFTSKRILPQISTLSPTDFTDFGTVTLNGKIINLGTPTIHEKGFCYATHINPTIGDTKITVSGLEKGEFSSQIWMSEKGATYYYRVYAIQGETVIYGDNVAISKEKRMAQIKTLDEHSVSVNGAFVYGDVLDVGYPQITERGIVYGTTPSPTIRNYKKTDFYHTTGEYEVFLLEGLSGGKTCYYRAYVMQDGNPIYGAQKSFIMHQMPGIITMPVYFTEKYIDDSHIYYRADVEGLIVADGYPACDAFGFVYSQDEVPVAGAIGSITVVVQDMYIESTYKVFKHTLERLNSSGIYYVRAFGRTGNNYYYGEVQSFHTGSY